MDFSVVDLTDEDQEFLNRARRFLDANVTDEVLRREHENGDGFIEDLHLACLRPLGSVLVSRKMYRQLASAGSGPTSRYVTASFHQALVRIRRRA